MHITLAILQQLETKLADRINEHADLCAIEEGTDGTWRAVAHYDGVEDKGYRADVAFTYRLAGENDLVEDFRLLSFDGVGLFNPDIKFD